MDIISTFKNHYCQFDQDTINCLDSLYADNIAFTDPVHNIEGLDHLKAYFSSISKNLTSCHFEFVGETIADDSAWFKWIMHYQHPQIKKGEKLSLTGATYIRFIGSPNEQKIIAHEDFYDMGSMLYEHTPIIGMGVRWLKQQLASAR